jgi:hypothetical protein
MRALALLLLLPPTLAHFTLSFPATLGFNDDDEGTGPCGGAKATDSSTFTDWHVGGDAIAINNLHPEGTWLFRATLDLTAASGWVAIFPQVYQSGIGKFCEPELAVNNDTWVGKKGLVSAVVSGQDGVLYQVKLCLSAFVPPFRLLT